MKARSSHSEVVPLEAASTLKWTVSCESQDISLEILFQSDDFSQITVSRAERGSTFSGSFTSASRGQLKFIFDNSFSWTKSKSINCQFERLGTSYHPSFELQLGRTLQTMYGRATIEARRHPIDSTGSILYVCKLPYGTASLHPTAFLLVQNELRHAGAAARFASLCPALALPPSQDYQTEPVESDNERVMIGIHMFFNNRVEEAEAFFGPEADKSLIFALAFGAIAFLRASLTWEPHELEEAKRRLQAAQTMAERALSNLGSSSSWFSSKTISPHELHAHLDSTIISAECNLVCAADLLPPPPPPPPSPPLFLIKR